MSSTLTNNKILTEMSYSIFQRSVTEFINDEIKLPRFQRKSTWKPGQGFELIISMAKEYPMGVVVINQEQGSLWLLDGRQRLNTFTNFRNNPNVVYEAARKYIKFNDKTTDEDLKTKFWNKIEYYLENISNDKSSKDKKEYFDENEDSGSSNIEFEDTENIDEIPEGGIDRVRQQEGLKTLLDIIRMAHFRVPNNVHHKKYGSWERLFRLDEYLINIPYQLKKEGFVINPEQLREYLLKLGLEAEKANISLSSDYFIEKVEEMIKPEKEEDFRAYISHNWMEMEHVINTIVRSEKLFRSATIGVIMIQNVTPLDAQNIFTKINKGGSPLTNEELNSAKPFWNDVIIGYNPEVQPLVKKLYERLGVYTDGNVVKWDLVATLMSRIKDWNILFERYEESASTSSSETLRFPEIGHGFKLIASYFTKGVSNVKINALEVCQGIRWPQTIDDFVVDFNNMCNALKEDKLFSKLIFWKRPLIKLIGESATYEFCSIMLSEWKNLGEPQNKGVQRNIFHRKARILFDTLVYEYATGFWKGTGDAKMSNHVKSPENRFKPTSQENWDRLIDGLCTTGQFNGSLVSKPNIDALVYYQFVLRNVQHPLDDAKYEIDHTIPKALLKDHPNVPEWFLDSLVNLSILPNIDNNSKKDRRLSDINGTSIGNVVSRFIGIEESDFDKYSDLANLNGFIESRKELLKNTFGSKRQSFLAN